ncbi:MAG: IS110 family transposase [Planctomycetota bacterium]
MRFYTGRHARYCGIDLHARTMAVCIVDNDGHILVERNIRCEPAEFLGLIAPFREDLVVGAECVFCWYWLADLCAAEGLHFVLGHALYMRAIHGGKAKNDRIDAFKIASLLRGGNLPVSYVYPAEMRATRDLLRRRLHLVRERGFLLAHVQNTHHQYNMVPQAARIAHKCNREGVAERFADPAVQKTVEVDLDVVGHLDGVIAELERHLERSVKVHDQDNFYLLRSVPGIGKVLAMTILYEIHDIARFPRVQDFASYARLIRPGKESAGKRTGGGGGAKIGNAHLKWAVSEAAVLMLRHGDVEKLMNRLRKKHGKAKAMGVLAHKLGRTIYYMLLRRKPFDLERFLAA